MMTDTHNPSPRDDKDSRRKPAANEQAVPAPRQDTEVPTNPAPAERPKAPATPAHNDPPLILAPDRPPSHAIRRAINVITRSAVVESNQPDEEQPAARRVPAVATPWALEQFFNGEVDLDVELAQRFPNMPMMSVVSFREMGDKKRHGVASLTTQDGSASVHLDVDTKTRVMQMSFTFASMLTLRFILGELSDIDRRRWLDLMRRDQGGLAFLWGASRWETDYMVCVVRRYYTNLYAFSPNNFEAAVRLTPEVTGKLLKWLDQLWSVPNTDDNPSDDPLLTW